MSSYDHDFSDSIRVNLTIFAKCLFLEAVEVDVAVREVSFGGEVRVCEFVRLPAACKGVVFAPRPFGNFMFVEPDCGWQIDVEPVAWRRIFVRRKSLASILVGGEEIWTPEVRR